MAPIGGIRVLLSENDIALFARVSGDRNPLHCSVEHARGTPFGRIVAHGVLAVLATLDEQQPRPGGVSAIEVEFRNPVHPGVRYRSRALRESRAGTGYQLRDGERVCLTVRVRPGPAPDLDPVTVAPLPSALRHTIADLPPGSTASGDYGPAQLAELETRFPAATALLGRAALACLLWSSYLAGMRMPGERCLLSGISLRFPKATASGRVRLGYRARVAHTDTRFGLVSLNGQVTADGEALADAEIETVIRTPAPPPSAANIQRRLVPSTRLRGMSAVVVGGSRGLGAAVSLALASQGCEVFVGHRGAFPEAVLKESVELTGRLHSVPGDAGSPEWSVALRSRAERVDFLVCSAAPPIRALDLVPAHLERVDEFLTDSLRLVSAPLAGLLDLVAAARGRCLVISSSAVSEPPRDWPHYIAAKSAVEGLVDWAARHHPSVGFLLARPGMLRTEQMNTPGAWETACPVEPVAAELVRRLLDTMPVTGVPLLIEDLADPAVVPPAGQP
jgi:NAD(P)-dependent dehydrogenase (short-subunit alcohol dehydrogenase family)